MYVVNVSLQLQVHVCDYIKRPLRDRGGVSQAAMTMFTTGFRQNEKEAENHKFKTNSSNGELVECINIVFTVLLIINASIRHGIKLMIAVAIWVQASASMSTERQDGRLGATCGARICFCQRDG